MHKKHWILSGLILLSFSLFALLAFRVWSGHIFKIDEEAFAVAFSLRNPLMDVFMRTITFLGSSFFLLPANVVMVCLLLFYHKNQFFGLHWAITSLGSLILMHLFKSVYQRSRPLDPYLESASGFSFPSGHTLNGLVFFGLLILYISKSKMGPALKSPAKAICLIFIFLIGFSRIYLRVHYSSDVLGGFTLGMGWLVLTIYFYDNFRSRHQSKTLSK